MQYCFAGQFCGLNRTCRPHAQGQEMLHGGIPKVRCVAPAVPTDAYIQCGWTRRPTRRLQRLCARTSPLRTSETISEVTVPKPPLLYPVCRLTSCANQGCKKQIPLPCPDTATLHEVKTPLLPWSPYPRYVNAHLVPIILVPNCRVSECTRLDFESFCMNGLTAEQKCLV